MTITRDAHGNISITGADDIKRYGLIVLRSEIALHMKVPAFNRTRTLHNCRCAGFTGITLKQAQKWIDKECDAMGIARSTSTPPDAV